MIFKTKSLRVRLFFMILLPLIIISAFLGSARYLYDRQTAEALFDRALLLAALAVSRDVGISEGDSLSHRTRKLISEAADGEIFYHVSGPDGIYITGYAYPPVADPSTITRYNDQKYFESIYREEKVRVLVIREHTVLENLAGDKIVTVWQRLQEREFFSRQMGMRTLALLVALMCVLAGVVWISVQRGLLPLLDIQDAISQRSPDDLALIKRPVPLEVSGIVKTLNHLFKQLAHSIQSQQDFISDAAHQLRNPANAVLSMAESLKDAKTDADRIERTQQLLRAARASARITEQLLSLERLNTITQDQKLERLELNSLAREICEEAAPFILKRDLGFEFIQAKDRLMILADKVFIREAIRNLIDNADKHGGRGLKNIRVKTGLKDDMAVVTVLDDGKGLFPEDSDKAFSRFGQLEPSSGSGLGLAIVSSVAARHDGLLQIDDVNQGTSISLYLPRVTQS